MGDKKADQVTISLIDYDEKNVQERDIRDIEEVFPLREKPTVTWINNCGIHEVELMEKVGKHFKIHPRAYLHGLLLILDKLIMTG